MKKWLAVLRSKCNLISAVNVLALVMVISTVNATCSWAHYQPEVPEAALKFKKI